MNKNIANKSFSIIVPSYNSASFIEKNIVSLISQNYNKNLIQILVIDDGSNDNLKQIINDIKNKFLEHSNSIEYYYKPNGNWGSVINYVLNNKLAKNDIISILDSDDIYLKNCLYEVNKNFKDNQIFAISFKRWDGNNKTSTKIYPYWNFLHKKIKESKYTPFCAPISFFYRKELFYKLNPLTEKIAYQDSVLFGQMLNLAKSIGFSKKTLAYYFYKRPNSTTSLEWSEKRFNEELKACYDLLEIDCQEILVYRLCVKEFRKFLEKMNIKFNINRQNKFYFFPVPIRLLFNVFYYFKLKKYFN